VRKIYPVSGCSDVNNPTRTSRNQDVDIQNRLKTPQWVRVQGVFLKKFYPVCVEFYSLVTTPRPGVYPEEGAPDGAVAKQL
jgi:hypothetical protein